MLKDRISKLKDGESKIEGIETNIKELEKLLLLGVTENSVSGGAQVSNPESVSFKHIEPPDENIDPNSQEQPVYNMLSCQNQETYMHSEHFNQERPMSTFENEDHPNSEGAHHLGDQGGLHPTEGGNPIGDETLEQLEQSGEILQTRG